MLSVTVGTGGATCAFDGRSGDIDLLLWPVNFTLACVGFSVLRPFVAYGVEAGLRCSEASVVEERLRRIGERLADTLARLDEVATVPFNRMADWGPDGRIPPAAPTHSPFIRHRQHLPLDWSPSTHRSRERDPHDGRLVACADGR